MNLALLYWILMLLWAVLSVVWNRPTTPYGWGGSILQFVLFFIVGVQVFGGPIHR